MTNLFLKSKRFICVTIAILMFMACIPMDVFAASPKIIFINGENGNNVIISNSAVKDNATGSDANANGSVAKVGDTEYATLQAAIDAVQSGETITLLRDVEATGVILIDKSITINGNGHKVTSSATRVFRVTTGNVEVIFNDLVIVSTAVRAPNVDSIRGISVDGGFTGIELTLNDCSVDFTDATASDCSYAVNIVSGSNHTLTVNGGTYEGANVINLWGTDHKVTITGATLNNIYGINDQYHGCIVRVESQIDELTLKNNTFNGTHAKVISYAENAAVESLVEENNIDNTQRYVVKVGSNYYYTLEDAIADATEGDTVTLLASITSSAIITIDKAITLDGNGKTLTSTAARAINVSGANGVTIKNLTIKASGERAINIIQNATNVTIDNVTATAANYTVNVAASAPNAVVAIQNSNLTGLNVVNVGAAGAKVTITGGTITCNDQNDSENYAALSLNKDAVNATITTTGVNFDIKGGSDKASNGAEGGKITIDGSIEDVSVDVAYISYGNNYYGYKTLADAFAAAQEGDTITLLANATPALTSQRAITKAAVIDLNGKTLTLTEDDLYFGTTTFKNGTIVVAPSVKASTAVFWMFANQTLTFDGVKLVATGVTGTYLIGLDGNNSDLNLLNGSEIVVENTTALDLDIICVNASTGNDIVIDNSKVNVTNLDGRVFFRGNYTVSGASEIALEGITKAGFRIEAGQTLSIEDTASVTIKGKPRDGGIHLTDITATYTVADTAKVEADVNEPIAAAKIGDKKYATLAEAIAAAKTMAGDVVVGIYDKVTLNTSLSGSFDSIKFVGKDTDAEIYLDVQGYITATGKKVAFKDLKLSKSKGGYIANAGFMNVAFGVYDVTEVTYTNCTFANGAYASSGKVTFTECTFNRSHDKYSLWAYGDVNVVVDDCTFADYRGIKMYAEGGAKTVDLTVKNTNFSAVTDKPAIVLTYGERVTLEGNTYSSTGVFELDLDGAPNGVSVTSDVPPTCKNDNGACGVLVDGKIYTTVAQAAGAATNGSKVTLLHNSAETVEFEKGVNLDKNGFTAGGVTVKLPDYVAQIGDVKFETVAGALAYAKDQNMTDVVITLIGETTKESALALEDTFDLYTKKVFNSVTFKQADASKVYYIDSIYTGSRINDGDFVFDGVNLIVTGQYMFEGNVVLQNNSVIKSVAEANCFIYNGETTVEPGSKLYGVIEDFRGGDLIIDGGKTDGSYNTEPDMQDAILVVNWSGDKLVLKNGAYLKVNASNEVGRLTLNAGTCAELSASKLEAVEYIVVNGSVIMDIASLITTKKITGSGKIIIDATKLSKTTQVIKADMSEFTGTIEITKNDNVICERTNTGVVVKVAAAKIGETKYATLAEALAAAQDGDTITLLWNEGDAPIAMNGAVYGKTVTITGTATVDWSKGFLFVGRGGEGNGTVIFDNAKLTSASNSSSYGIHVSGREKNTNNKYDGTLIIKNSTIELDYLINKGTMTLDNSTLTVNNGFAVGGRPASETESGADATATLNITNGSKVVVNNHNGMGLGYEAIGVMNIDANSIFETSQSFLVTAKGTMNIAGSVKIAGTLTNNGSIVLNNVGATLTSSECGNVTTNVEFYVVVYENGTYMVKVKHLIIMVGTSVVPVDSDDSVVIYVTTMDKAVTNALQYGAQSVTYKIGGAVELTTGFSHGIIDLGKNVTIEGADPNAKLTIVGGGVPDFKGVTFKNITLADEGTYLPTVNEFMYQNYIDCTFVGVIFAEGIRVSGNTTITKCTINSSNNNQYALWVDGGKVTMTGTTVNVDSEGYGMVKSDTATEYYLTGNTFEYKNEANKEAFNTKDAKISASSNTFIGCIKGIIPTDKTNYAADGTTLNEKTIVLNNTIAVAQIVDKENQIVGTYATLADAIAAANAGETIKLVAATTADTIVLNKGITLDLAGKTLTANYLVAFKGNNVIDSTKGKGLLKIAKDNIMLSEGNADMAVYTGEGYKFAKITMQSGLDETTSDGFKIGARPGFSKDIYDVLNLSGAVDNSGLQILIRISWVEDGWERYQDFICSSEMIDNLYKNNKNQIKLTVTGLSDRQTNVGATIIVTSNIGVKSYGEIELSGENT